MDRTKRNQMQVGAVVPELMLLVAAAVALAAGVVLESTPARAETVLVRPPKPRPQTGPESPYAESRFGAQPAPVDLGVGSHYAATQVEEMDSDLHGAGDTDDTRADAGPSRITRAPAALSFGQVEPSRGLTPMQAEQMMAPAQRQVPKSDFSATLPDTMKKGIQEVALIAGDLGYFPKTVFVSRDVPVRMYVTGASKNTLCLMMDSFQIKKQVRSQKIEEVTFTPTVPGKYRYYCPVNGMEGTMIVKELSSAALVSSDNNE